MFITLPTLSCAPSPKRRVRSAKPSLGHCLSSEGVSAWRMFEDPCVPVWSIQCVECIRQMLSMAVAYTGNNNTTMATIGFRRRSHGRNQNPTISGHVKAEAIQYWVKASETDFWSYQAMRS